MSTDNKPTVQQAAKQGNPQAIAILLNRQLQSKGITAKVSAKDSCLQIMLEAANVPDQKGLVTAIQKWIDGLDVDSIQRVQIYAKQTGEDIPAWNDSFEIVTQLEEPKIADTVISPTAPTETVKNDVKVEETNTSKLDPALLELAKNGDTKVISELIKNTLQQPDIKVRATLNKGLLQVVIVSNQVPKQDSSVEAIPKLVQDFNSNLIEKLKVIGMREIEGSSSSNTYWIQESLIAKPFVKDVISNNNNIQNSSRKDLNSHKTNLQTFSIFKFVYFRIHPAIKIFVVIISLLSMAYYNSYLGKFKDAIYVNQKLTDGLVELYISQINRLDRLKSEGKLGAKGLEKLNSNNEAIEEIYEDRQKMEISYNYHTKVFNFLFFLSPTIILACICMEILYRVNLKKIRSEYKKEYQLLKEELRTDPNDNVLREKVLETARLGGYDEQTIANDLSIIN